MLITAPCQIQLAEIPVAAEARGQGFLPGVRNLEAQSPGAVLLAAGKAVAGQDPQNLEVQTLVVALHNQPGKEEVAQAILEAASPERSQEVRVDSAGEEECFGNQRLQVPQGVLCSSAGMHRHLPFLLA